MYDDQPWIPDSYAIDVALLTDSNNGTMMERNSNSPFIHRLLDIRERQQRRLQQS